MIKSHMVIDKILKCFIIVFKHKCALNISKVIENSILYYIIFSPFFAYFSMFFYFDYIKNS